MKPKFIPARFRNQAMGATLVSALFVSFSDSSQASDWNGSTSSDWNTTTNWSFGAVPADNAVINTTTPNIAKITAALAATPLDILIGSGTSVTGRLDHVSGAAANAANRSMILGNTGGGSSGTFNLADTSSAGGGVSGFAQGSGSMTIGGGPSNNGNLIAGDFAGSTGTVNVNTSGSLVVTNDIFIGRGSSTAVGVMNLENGAVTAGAVGNGCWVAFGRSGGNGTLNMSGGSIISYGSMYFPRDSGSTGLCNMSGGTLDCRDGTFAVADGGTGTFNMTGGTIQTNGREFWVGNWGGGGGNGSFNFSAGSINVGSWVAIGRDGGTGNFNMTGGTFTKTGNGTQFIVGASGPGTMTQSAGLVDVQQGYTWVGEAGGATTATYTISGTAEFRSSLISVGPESPNATLNLNGGTVRTRKFLGSRDENSGATSGTGTVNFNGSQIIATASNTDFIATSLDNAVIGTGGLLVNSNSFTLGVPKALSGTGGVVKSGAGKLSLTGLNTYGGSNTVNAGELVLSSSGSGTGDITLADGTAVGVSASLFVGDQLQTTNATFGTTAAGTTLNLNIGNVAGTNPSTSILDVTGNLSTPGNVLVNVSGSQFQAANMPLVTYNAASRTGAGVFTLGTLPNGVVASIVDDPNFYGPNLGLVYLNITSVALPKWDGSDSVKYAKTADVTTGLFDVVVNNNTNIVVGQKAVGAGIPTGAVVTAISGLTITLDQAATATSIASPVTFTAATGSNDGIWDINTTQNWVDQVTSGNSVYKDPNPVLFDDSATGPSAVTLNVTANPSEVVFNNSTLAYSLSGTGKISGSSSLSKSGTGALTVNTTNDYTGVTTLSGGTTTVASLTNGGVASPLGAAAASPANLVLGGGTLNYTGGAASIDRGLTITGASTISAANNISTSGQLLSTAGGITKTGAGTLTLTNAGPNALGAATVNGGTLVLDGTGGAQTTAATGFSLGGGANADLLVDSTLNVAGDVNIATSAGTSTLTLSGASKFTTTNRVMTGMNVAGATGNIVIQNTSQFIMTGGWLSVGQTGGGSGTMTVKDSGSFTMPGSDFNVSDLNNSTGTLNLQDNGSIYAGNQSFWGKGTGSSATVNISGGTYTTINNHSVANGTNTATVTLSGGTLTVGGECYWADGGGTSVTVTQTGGTVNMNGGYNPLGRNGTLVWTQSAGTVNGNGWTILGRDGTGNGTLNISGGTFNQTQADRPLMVGEFGVGTLTVSGTAQVNSAGANGLILANEPAGTGTVNLNGGTLTVRRVREGNDGNGGNGGNSTFNFAGGVLKAGAGANANFMSGLNSAVVQPGGAFIDTNGQTVSIAQALNDGGNGFLTKQGAGTLLLNGVNSYLGLTTVQTGTLGGTGSIDGPLQVDAGASLNPGASAGTFTTFDSATIDGTYICEVDGANVDKLDVGGTLTLSVGSTLDFNELSAPSGAVLVIASYGTLSGTFTTVTDLPSGYTLDYNYNGLNQIALVSAATPYSTWVSGYGLDPLTDGAPGVDKDNDGQNNATEFALGGDPTSGSNNAKIYNLVADSDADGDATSELLMTIAVRSGTPAFAGSPSPTATMDGMTYTIQGSTDLSAFTTIVNPASPVTTGLPAAPSGYEYRTFSLDGSNGTPSKGFLRVQVTF